MAEAPDYPPEFEDGLKKKVLRLPRCRACGRFHWYPMDYCPHCLSADLEWAETSGAGTIFTCSTVEHAFDEDWVEAIPYTVALIEFAEAPGVRLVARLLEDEPGATTIGAQVEPFFLIDRGRPNVVFRPAGSKKMGE